MSQVVHVNTIEKLEEVLGFDPIKSGATTSNMVAIAIQELQTERSEETQKRVKSLLSEAIDLRKKQAETKKKFDNENIKFERLNI